MMFTELQPSHPVLVVHRRGRPLPFKGRNFAPSATKLKDNPDTQKGAKEEAEARESVHDKKDGTSGKSGTDEGMLKLPAGYKVSRRDALKLIPAAGAAAATYSLIQNWKAFSYVSPNALLKAAFPDQQGPEQADVGPEGRIAAFKQYISDKEKRATMQLVPDFPSGLTWFNSSPLSMQRELKGRVVVLDFWTYCCVNCLHVLPGLAALERRYAGQPFNVIGVHSAKFDNEKDDESIRNAVIRYDIQHPCVNDGQMTLWRELGISSWPTLAVVSPAGRLIATLPGEGQEENVDAFVQAALSYYGEKKMLEDKALPILLEKEKDQRLLQSPLRYPGKLATDVPGNRLFISDSNNHRIVITDLDGNFLDHIGGNGPFLKDGSFNSSSFNHPQGIVYSKKLNALFVTDTENHALRQVDLTSKTVTTLAGNGQKGSDYRGGRKGRNQQLNSPWDLTLDHEEEVLYIALAGQHQIWTHYLTTGTTKCFSGNGAERNANSGSAQSTSWAQPSGLSMAIDGSEVIVADSESSCVRAFSTATGGARALVGGDPTFSDNLFKFGDRDGRGSEALLQHPLGVCVIDSSTVLVADTYNHRVKVLDTAQRRVRSIAGNGAAGFADGKSSEAQLSEPSGLAPGPGRVAFVADTNNHLIRILTLDDGSISTLDLKGVPGPRTSPEASTEEPTSIPTGAELVVADTIQASTGVLRIKINLPPGYHLTKGANSSFAISSLQPGAISFRDPAGSLLGEDNPEAAIQFRRSSAARATLRAKVYFCVTGGACLFREVAFQLDFAALPKGDADSNLVHEIIL